MLRISPEGPSDGRPPRKRVDEAGRSGSALAGTPGAARARLPRWGELGGRRHPVTQGSSSHGPRGTETMLWPCHRGSPLVAAGDPRRSPGVRAGGTAGGAHLGQGPPVHVGAAQVDVKPVHHPELGVQDAAGEPPQGHLAHLGTWPGAGAGHRVNRLPGGLGALRRLRSPRTAVCWVGAALWAGKLRHRLAPCRHLGPPAAPAGHPALCPSDGRGAAWKRPGAQCRPSTHAHPRAGGAGTHLGRPRP